jgi:hypothetical protein
VSELAEAPPEVLAHPGADPAVKPYAEITDYLGLLTAIRARIVELDVSYERINALAGVADGYLAKLLCDPPIKYFGTLSVFLVLQVLGLRIALVHDPEALAQVQSRLIRRPPRYSQPRKPRKERRPSKRILARRAARQARWQRIAGSASASAV